MLSIGFIERPSKSTILRSESMFYSNELPVPNLLNDIIVLGLISQVGQKNIDLNLFIMADIRPGRHRTMFQQVASQIAHNKQHSNTNLFALSRKRSNSSNPRIGSGTAIRSTHRGGSGTGIRAIHRSASDLGGNRSRSKSVIKEYLVVTFLSQSDRYNLIVSISPLNSQLQTEVAAWTICQLVRRVTETTINSGRRD